MHSSAPAGSLLSVPLRQQERDCWRATRYQGLQGCRGTDTAKHSLGRLCMASPALPAHAGRGLAVSVRARVATPSVRPCRGSDRTRIMLSKIRRMCCAIRALPPTQHNSQLNIRAGTTGARRVYPRWGAVPLHGARQLRIALTPTVERHQRCLVEEPP